MKRWMPYNMWVLLVVGGALFFSLVCAQPAVAQEKAVPIEADGTVTPEEMPKLTPKEATEQQLPVLLDLALGGTLDEFAGAMDALHASGLADSTLLQPLEALRATREGRHSVARAWYDGLTNQQKRRFRPLVAGSLFATNRYDLEGAEAEIKRLERLRLRDEADKVLREQVVDHYEKVARQLRTTRQLETLYYMEGGLGEILDFVRSQTAHLGEVHERYYVTADGLARWEVTEGGDGLRIIYRLGDGSWDTDNPTMVEMLGVPEGATLSYPFLMPDGQTLYFAMQERGIAPEDLLGERDLFVSRYDRQSETLLAPQQLPMPINSTSDDLLYILDRDEDVAFVVTTRGMRHGETRLYVYRPSSELRYDGEAVAQVALWEAPEVTGQWMPKRIEVQEEVKNEEVYFYIGRRPIRSADDLQNASGRYLFGQYLEALNNFNDINDQLEGLRQEVTNNPQRMEGLRPKIIGLERELENWRMLVKALRNEVIRLE